jgi:hypothetical protein
MLALLLLPLSTVANAFVHINVHMFSMTCFSLLHLFPASKRFSARRFIFLFHFAPGWVGKVHIGDIMIQHFRTAGFMCKYPQVASCNLNSNAHAKALIKSCPQNLASGHLAILPATCTPTRDSTRPERCSAAPLRFCELLLSKDLRQCCS